MDTISAFAKGEASRGKELMVFDWNKAATLIKSNGAAEASAGLSGDWEWTGGEIFTDGDINIDTYTYLASTWATPEIIIGGAIIDCFIMKSKVPHEWLNECKDYASIKWPLSAREIMNS